MAAIPLPADRHVDRRRAGVHQWRPACRQRREPGHLAQFGYTSLYDTARSGPVAHPLDANDEQLFTDLNA
jgi:hypothetical protein